MVSPSLSSLAWLAGNAKPDDGKDSFHNCRRSGGAAALAGVAMSILLIEDQLGVRPAHGFIVLGDGTRHRIENTSELRAYVLELSCRVPSA